MTISTSTKFSNKQAKRSYINEKIRLLKQFCINFTDEEITHLWSLDSEIAVDNFCKMKFKEM